MREVEEEAAEEKIEIHAGIHLAAICFTMLIKERICNDQWTLRYTL